MYATPPQAGILSNLEDLPNIKHLQKLAHPQNTACNVASFTHQESFVLCVTENQTIQEGNLNVL